jgi:hypothetical protein
MVRVPSPEGTFCIDSTEVTRAQYTVFTADIAAKGAAGEASLEKADICLAVTVSPAADCMQENAVCKNSCDQHPQVCVSWCAGVRLLQVGRQAALRRHGRQVDQNVDWRASQQRVAPCVWQRYLCRRNATNAIQLR